MLGTPLTSNVKIEGNTTDVKGKACYQTPGSRDGEWGSRGVGELVAVTTKYKAAQPNAALPKGGNP